MSRNALYLALVLSLVGCSSGIFRGYAEGRSSMLAEIEARGHSPTGATRFAFDDLGSLNTDAFRTHAFPWKLFVAALLAHRTPDGEPLPRSAGALLSVGPTAGYAAPPLTGLWATAPYLHNGSVPTLWHLMHPEERPTRFEVGGHRLDYVRVGIDLVPHETAHRYPSGYAPWSLPVIYDTARPGQSNSGHEAPFRNLTEAEKTALTEYLKLL